MGWKRISKKTMGAIGVIALTSGALIATMVTPGGAASPSDDRATFNSGNAVNCGQVGFPGSQTAFGAGANPITAGGFTTTITGNGTQANISLPLPAGVVVQAVVVKGGPAYNVYTDAAVLPPTLASPQNYISPLNGGGNVPTISHWFICYTGGNPPPPEPNPGSVLVFKIVTNVGAGVVPTNTTANIVCDDGTNETVTLPANGGNALEGPITVDSVGTNCTVSETGFPVGVTYTVSPVEATPGDDGVNVPAETQVIVSITNNYVNVQAAVVVTPTFTG